MRSIRKRPVSTKESIRFEHKSAISLHNSANPSLWAFTVCLVRQVLNSLAPEVLQHLKAELQFFDDLTEVSGKLYPVPKDMRKAAAVQLVQKVQEININA